MTTFTLGAENVEPDPECGRRVVGWRIIIARLARMDSSGAEAGAYAAGQAAGFVFDLLLLGVGAYYLLKKSKA